MRTTLNKYHFATILLLLALSTSGCISEAQQKIGEAIPGTDTVIIKNVDYIGHVVGSERCEDEFAVQYAGQQERLDSCYITQVNDDFKQIDCVCYVKKGL